MNHYRSSQTQQLPEDGLTRLEKYMGVAPHLVPRPTDDAASSNVLWHPDLYLNNIFLDPDNYQITCIVDWQSACVAPLFFQSTVTRMCRHPGPVQQGWVIPQRPEDFVSLNEDDQKRVDDDLDSERLHKYYEARMCKLAPRHWTVLEQQTIPIIRKPVELVSGVSENRDLFTLRDSLMSLIDKWDALFSDLPCPIDFSIQEKELHAKEEEDVDGVSQMLTLVRDECVLPVDGMVEAEDYDTACRNNRKFRDVLLHLPRMKRRERCSEISGRIKCLRVKASC